ADTVLKATMVDGVYDSDPKKNPDAKRYDRVSFQECISKQLKVMDATAFSLCMDNRIPIVVFDLEKPGNVTEALLGADIGTVVDAEGA
ncbi:MAG: UMP kinase, partial [Haloferula sp.]